MDIKATLVLLEMMETRAIREYKVPSVPLGLQDPKAQMVHPEFRD